MKQWKNFRNLFVRIGTYAFAVNSYEVDALSGNYINLVIKMKLLAALCQKKNQQMMALNQFCLVMRIYMMKNRKFVKNLRSLETRVAKGVTTSTLLENYCKKSIDSMNRYQQEIKLVRNVQSGDASRELD